MDSILFRACTGLMIGVAVDTDLSAKIIDGFRYRSKLEVEKKKHAGTVFGLTQIRQSSQ
jgi:hypothetical protein